MSPGNGTRLVNALPQGKLLYLPKMGHALHVASCRCMKQLDTGKDATRVPGLAAGIIDWLRGTFQSLRPATRARQDTAQGHWQIAPRLIYPGPVWQT